MKESLKAIGLLLLLVTAYSVVAYIDQSALESYKHVGL